MLQQKLPKPMPAKESTTQTRFKKSCETFCTRLRKQNPLIFKEFSEITISSRPQQVKEINIQTRLDYLKDIVNLFRGNNDLIGELNKLLHKDA